MKELTEYLLNYLVDQPEKMEVSEETSETGSLILRVTVATEDMGKVIGKGGKVIRALRDVVKILALKENKHVDILLEE